MAVVPRKNEMPVQPPEYRIHNFREVAEGYTPELAQAEARRCLHCRNRPCVSGCPVNIAIPDFIGHIRDGNFEKAYQVIARSSALPAVCGRVCPQESQCEAKCTLGVKFQPVAIGALERFAADWHSRHAGEETVPPPTGKLAAIVGSGPAGLTCAGELVRSGYRVSVFEALHTAGGVLAYGIPEFRLPKAIVEREVRGLEAMGVEIQTNVVIGKTLTVDELFEKGYQAVFLASGAGLPKFLNIPGEMSLGVYSANEFLTRNNLMKAYRKDAATPIQRGGRVAVIGGGNVAMDAARTAVRLGADKTYVIYRRSMEELPARKEEVTHALEEGIDFRLLTSPVEILACRNPKDPRDPQNGRVKGLRCISMELGAPDAQGRRSPVPLPGTEFDLPVDCVIIAVGTSPNPLIPASVEGLNVSGHGGIVVTETGQTSRPGVFAGGDAVTGSATVISAMGAGKRAARAMDEYLRGLDR